MTHNLQLDADAIVALQESSVKYSFLGLVRKQQVLTWRLKNLNSLVQSLAPLACAWG